MWLILSSNASFSVLLKKFSFAYLLNFVLKVKAHLLNSTQSWRGENAPFSFFIFTYLMISSEYFWFFGYCGIEQSEFSDVHKFSQSKKSLFFFKAEMCDFCASVHQTQPSNIIQFNKFWEVHFHINLIYSGYFSKLLKIILLFINLFIFIIYFSFIIRFPYIFGLYIFAHFVKLFLHQNMSIKASIFLSKLF